MTIPPFLKSRKFWALIVGALMLIARTYVPTFPLSDDQVAEVVYLLVAYIIGTGLESSRFTVPAPSR